MKKRPSYERIFERIEEESESNPLVGNSYQETAQFVESLGYSPSGAVYVIRKYEDTYDLNLYRKSRDNHHTESGEIIEREFGVTKKSNKAMYSKLMSFFYNRTVLKGWTEQEALKLMHERYDSVLAKERVQEPQTADVTIPLSGRALYKERLSTCEDSDVEL